MFAIAAIIAFALAVFKVELPVDLIALGLLFVSLHLLWPVGDRFYRRRV